MTVINALSTGSSGGVEEGFSSGSSSPQNMDAAAGVFAAIFGNWLNQSGQGQDSGDQSYEPAGKDANSGRYALLGNDGLQALMGMFVLNEEQGELQGVLPSELTSELTSELQNELYSKLQSELLGDVPDELLQQIVAQMSQGGFITDKNLSQQLDNILRQFAGNQANQMGNLEVALSGMTSDLRGMNPSNAELDLYRNFIVNMLQNMSGKIRVENQAQSRAENPLNPELPGNNQTFDPQKMELAAQRLNSGLFLNLEGVAKEPISPNPQQVLVNGVGSIGLPQGTMNSGQEGTFQNQGDSQGDFADNLKQNQSAVASSQVSTGKETPTFSVNVAEEGVGMAGTNSKTGLAEESLESFSKKSFVDSAVAISQGKEIESVQGRSLERNLPVWTQVANEIWEKAYQARPRLQELTIQLYPRELGEINISMRWEDGQLAMRMIATDASTGQLLQNNLGELRESLTQLGIQCGSMETGEQGKEGSQEHTREGMGESHDSDSNPSDYLTLEELEALLEGEQDLEPGTPRINVRA